MVGFSSINSRTGRCSALTHPSNDGGALSIRWITLGVVDSVLPKVPLVSLIPRAHAQLGPACRILLQSQLSYAQGAAHGGDGTGKRSVRTFRTGRTRRHGLGLPRARSCDG